MSGWRASPPANSPDRYVDWAAGAAFGELDAETGGRHCYLVIKENGARVFADLQQLKDIVSVDKALADLAGPLPPDSIGTGAAGKGEAGGSEDDATISVIVGIIDDAIGFANERFRKTDSSGALLASRFEAFWLQDGRADNRFPAAGYGREFTKGEIEALLAAHGADEEALYRSAGVTDMGRPVITGAALREGHGSHVLDVAAGFSPVTEDRDARRQALIGVQLPRAVTRDTSGRFSYRLLMDALDYIIGQADFTMKRLGRRVPVVVNLSYGIAAGPHDGTLNVESGIDARVKAFNAKHPEAPLAVVIAAGNGYLERTRAKVALDAGVSRDIRFSVLPDDRTSSYVEVWLPKNHGDTTYSLTLTPAGLPASPPVISMKANDSVEYANAAGGTVCRASFVENGEGRGCFFIAMQPTTSNLAGAALAPSGWWTISLHQEGGTAGIADLWIQRDDSPFGTRRGRQAYFDDPDYVIFDPVSGRPVEEDNESYVKRAGSISAYGCGTEPLIISGFIEKEGIAAPYSAAGDTASGAVQRIAYPDAAAVSDDSRVHYGVLAAGIRSGSVVAMGGTSVAAPQITRLLAAEMAAGKVGAGKGKTMPRPWLKALASAGGFPSTRPLLHQPGERYGDGRVQANRSASRTPARYEP